MDSISFDDLMVRLQSGDQDAAFKIFQDYSNRLAGLARKRLQGALAAKVDPEDVLQSVFRSFFLRQQAGQFQIDGWDSLWSLLTVITMRKCGKQLDYFHAACRNVGRETSPPQNDDESYAACLAIATDPTPQESASLIETIELILSELSDRDRQIAELTFQGTSPAEISEVVKCSERTVERVRARLQQKLMSMIE